MDTTLLTGSPLDDLGRLVHEDDAAAQLALATVALEAAVTARGRRMCQLDELRVLTTDPAALADVLDVLTDRLDVLFAAPTVSIVPVARLAVPGQLVTLATVLRTSTKEPA